MRVRQLLAAAAVAALIAGAASVASAQQVYKWKDANGVVHYSQTAPASGTQYSKVRLSGEPDVSSNPAPTSAPAGAPASADQAGAAPRAASPGTQANTPANLKRLCSQLDANIATLQGKTPVVQQGSNGQQTVMSDDQREQQLATARSQQRQFCTPKGAGA